MARVTTLQDRVKEITRKYKHINGHRFVFNKRSELKGRFTHIKCWFLIHDSERGYSIFPFTFKRKAMFSVPEWTRLFKRAVGSYQPLMSIFTQAVLPAINNKGGNNWRFKALLCWTGVITFTDTQRKAGSRFAQPDAVQQAENISGNRRRDKTPNKRNANARKRNRRR